MLFTYAVNVPWMDDTDAFPDFLGRFLEAKNFDERVWLLFKPNNEHRIVYAKLMNLLHYALTGALNMRTLTIVSNITLFGMLWIFWRVIKEQKIAPIYFLPVPLLLLQPQYYLTSIWTITGFQYQPVVFFGLLGVYLLSRNTLLTFFGAVLAVFFDSFTMSNGLFYWMVGMVVLALQGRYKMLGVWMVFMMATFKLYFYRFDTEANDQGFTYFFKHPHESFFGFFTHLGGGLDFQTLSPILIRSIAPTIAGFILIGISIWWLFLKVFRTKDKFSIPNLWEKLQARFNNESSNYIILGCFLFLIINALVIAILRPRFGYFVMIVGNYKIYPATMLVVVYLMLLTGWLKFQSNQQYFKWILVGSIIFNLASYIKFLPEVHERRKDLLVRAFNQEHNQIGLGPYVGSDFDKYVQTALGRLIPKKIYQFPETIFTKSEKDILGKLPDNQPIKVDTSSVDGEIVISNPTLSTGFGFNNGVYLLLKSDRKNYLIYEKRNLQDFLKTGFSIKIPPKYLVPDTYKIGIFYVNGTTHQIFNANQTVEVTY
ncbi:MAG: hypothetical protein V4585_10455 [Bacteroidota bacterium]